MIRKIVEWTLVGIGMLAMALVLVVAGLATGIIRRRSLSR